MNRPDPLPDRTRDALSHAVQCNCHISDARHAGDYSLCIYLLKMRELYRWEQRLPLTETLPKADVGAWLQEREALWDDVEEAGYAPLPLAGERLDPFAADALNERLIGHGLVYGGGLGAGGKPLFFLGELLSDECREGLRILVSGTEFARDIAAPPAMLQGGTVYVRRESLRRFLWEKMEAWQWNRGNTHLGRVLTGYGFEEDAEAALDALTDAATETVTRHEIGEARAGRRLGDGWERMLMGLGRSRAEIAARAVRDLLADCASTLPYLIASDDERPLDFYLATFDGLRRELFPGLLEAAGEALRLDALATVVARGRAHWQTTASAMLAAWEEHGGDAAARIEQLADEAKLHR